MSQSGLDKGISVVTTTWNERENIEELIRRVRVTLKDVQHEIIVVDGNSTDGTLEVAQRFADVAVGKLREGQTKGLLYGAKLAKFPLIVTIDSDLENNPGLILDLVRMLDKYDVVVASRRVVPRISERWASKTLGKLVGATDFYSNFRIYRKNALVDRLIGGETFGGELLVAAKKNCCRVGELLYDAPPRRVKPRIGGTLWANWRITVASCKCFLIYIFG